MRGSVSFLFFFGGQKPLNEVREKLKTEKMRVEIDTEDLVELVKQFLIAGKIRDSDLLADITEMVTYGMEDFKHEVEITEF